MYLRLQWVSSMAVRDAECRWPSEWKWQATDSAAATKPSAKEKQWLDSWLKAPAFFRDTSETLRGGLAPTPRLHAAAAGGTPPPATTTTTG